MRALPLWQPWASLVAIGAKRVETRAYPPARLGLAIGERIAIHATKGGSKRDEAAVLARPVFAEALTDIDELPRGAIVCTAELARATQVTRGDAWRLRERNPSEFAFGDYREGRWAWVLEDVQRLAAPLPCQGHQGAFNVPDEIASVLGAAERGQEALFA